VLPEVPAPLSGTDQEGEFEEGGGNVQVNNPKQDYVQIFTGFRPFVRATQSETSLAAFGRNIVVTYNDSTGIHVIPNPTGPGLIVDRVTISGFGVSHDRGATWKTGFIPSAASAAETFGDPSVGVDRHGVFYFAHLAGDAHTFRFATFNVPGASDPTIFPVTQPGEFTECGATLIAPHTLALIRDACAETDSQQRRPAVFGGSVGRTSTGQRRHQRWFSTISKGHQAWTSE
jgi:hypothetical protein